MGFISSASGASMWRGYEYYKYKKVSSCSATSRNEFEGIVLGGKRYQVKIDVEHPRKSSCNCAFADGRRVICKHMVALYFTAFPQEAAAYYKQVLEWEKEDEERQEQTKRDVIEFVSNMSKEDLQRELLTILFDGPDWLYERFIKEHLE